MPPAVGGARASPAPGGEKPARVGGEAPPPDPLPCPVPTPGRGRGLDERAGLPASTRPKAGPKPIGRRCWRATFSGPVPSGRAEAPRIWVVDWSSYFIHVGFL